MFTITIIIIELNQIRHTYYIHLYSKILKYPLNNIYFLFKINVLVYIV